MSENKEMKCIICGKILESAFDNEIQPYGGTMFSTYGHYGSTVFDPMDGTQLILIICDPCLVEKGIDKKIFLYNEYDETHKQWVPSKKTQDWVKEQFEVH